MVVGGPLSAVLVQARLAVPASQPIYDAFVGRLRGAGVGSGSPQVGDIFPEFALPDASGRYRSLAAMLAGGPLVLSFNRGGWCRYCFHELTAWNGSLAALDAAGGRLAVVTGEVGGRASLLSQLLRGDAEVLCDVDHGLALASGLAFHVGPELQQYYRHAGLDLTEIYGSASGFLPVPATFVIDGGGIVRFAFADPDFRLRAEPAEVVAAVAGLTGAKR